MQENVIQRGSLLLVINPNRPNFGKIVVVETLSPPDMALCVEQDTPSGRLDSYLLPGDHGGMEDAIPVQLKDLPPDNAFVEALRAARITLGPWWEEIHYFSRGAETLESRAKYREHILRLAWSWCGTKEA